MLFNDPDGKFLRVIYRLSKALYSTLVIPRLTYKNVFKRFDVRRLTLDLKFVTFNLLFVTLEMELMCETVVLKNFSCVSSTYFYIYLACVIIRTKYFILLLIC